MPLLARVYHLSPGDVWHMTISEFNVFVDDAQRLAEGG